MAVKFTDGGVQEIVADALLAVAFTLSGVPGTAQGVTVFEAADERPVPECILRLDPEGVVVPVGQPGHRARHVCTCNRACRSDDRCFLEGMTQVLGDRFTPRCGGRRPCDGGRVVQGGRPDIGRCTRAAVRGSLVADVSDVVTWARTLWATTRNRYVVPLVSPVTCM